MLYLMLDTQCRREIFSFAIFTLLCVCCKRMAVLSLLAALLDTSQLLWSRHQVEYWLMKWDLVRLSKSLHVFWLIDEWAWHQSSPDRLTRHTHPCFARCVRVCCQYN